LASRPRPSHKGNKGILMTIYRDKQLRELFGIRDLLDFKPSFTNERWIHPSLLSNMSMDRDNAWAGVYFLLNEFSDGFEVMYVGQSNNMGARIAQHRADKRFNKVAFIYCVDEARRKQIESFYIYFCKPSYNLDIPAREPDGMVEFCRGW